MQNVLEKKKVMVRISPSIASSRMLDVVGEIHYIDSNFDSIHIDIEDGVAVNNISFGFKMCKEICSLSKSSEISIHLEVINPLKYINTIKELNITVVFIQIDCLKDPKSVVLEFIENGIPTGINISNLDFSNKNLLNELLLLTDKVLVNTTHHDDVKQICDLEMIDNALRLADIGKKVWIDGGITFDIYERVSDSRIHSAVMGRQIFSNKTEAVKYYTKMGRLNN